MVLVGVAADGLVGEAEAGEVEFSVVESLGDGVFEVAAEVHVELAQVEVHVGSCGVECVLAELVVEEFVDVERGVLVVVAGLGCFGAGEHESVGEVHFVGFEHFGVVGPVAHVVGVDDQVQAVASGFGFQVGDLHADFQEFALIGVEAGGFGVDP